MFEVAGDAQPLPGRPNLEISDVNASLGGLEHGAGFALFVREGLLDTLEAFSFDEPWPQSITAFELTYTGERRKLGSA